MAQPQPDNAIARSERWRPRLASRSFSAASPIDPELAHAKPFLVRFSDLIMTLESSVDMPDLVEAIEAFEIQTYRDFLARSCHERRLAALAAYGNADAISRRAFEAIVAGMNKLAGEANVARLHVAARETAALENHQARLSLMRLLLARASALVFGGDVARYQLAQHCADRAMLEPDPS